ncbi:hypothetical protein MNBD_GAMMA12-3702 [hydrothermal vent metagenome]|uniref:Uncharacterized protein n=1 Tax=hydrothermal vent metagenome TaxID=652676 RepID=A0A3B0XZN7_9ZZZZ
MLVVIILALSVLLGAWLSVISVEDISIDQFHLFANYLDEMVYDYAGWYLVLFCLLYIVGVVFLVKRMPIINQILHCIFWFIPMLILSNKLALIYYESLILPAQNIPYYVILLGLGWVAWQTSKFMSGSEASLVVKYGLSD